MRIHGFEHHEHSAENGLGESRKPEGAHGSSAVVEVRGAQTGVEALELMK